MELQNNLPQWRESHPPGTAYLNRELVTANLNNEVFKRRTMGPFSTPTF